jgi:hypothetical protein
MCFYLHFCLVKATNESSAYNWSNGLYISGIEEYIHQLDYFLVICDSESDNTFSQRRFHQ